MENVVDFKTKQDDLEVEFEIVSDSEEAIAVSDYNDEIESLRIIMDSNQKKIDAYEKEIKRLTNSDDWLDYTISVASGIIAGLVDVIFVGECSFAIANEWGNKTADSIVKKVAKAKGFKGDDVPGAIKHLEEAFPIAADKATNFFGGGYYHHLRDFSHHPTPIGLFFSILTQFTNRVYGTDVAGVFTSYELTGSELLLVGKNLPEKITFGVINWFFHLISDMAGSSKTVSVGGEGTGIPGPIGALLKEASALPIFNKRNENGYKEFSVWVTDLFRGTVLGDKKEPVKFDLRTEIGISEQAGLQSIPILINSCIVRGFYFIRHLISEIKTKKPKTFKEFFKLDWQTIAPFNNRSVQRMIVISMGTMTAIDLGDAAIETAIKGGVATAGTAGAGVGVFISTMILRVNFVGLGRFAIACGTDLRMGAQCERTRTKRLEMCIRQLKCENAIILYKEANMWKSAEMAIESIDEAYSLMTPVARGWRESWMDTKEDIEKIRNAIPGIEENNPGLTDRLNEILKWG